MSARTISKPLAPERERYRFTADEYHRMIAADFFGREDRVELINGELIMTPPTGPGHAAHSRSLREKIEARLPRQFLLCVDDPITLPPDSEPQPDFSIVRRRADFYKSGHPQPADVLLIIEIAKSSLEFDMETKALIYGRSGIREYWVLNIVAKCLHVFTDPTKHGYRTQQNFQPGEKVACGTVPRLKFQVAEMLL
jgi:Uma2 family endonuclease